MFNLENAGPPITEGDLTRLETTIGFPLSDSYRRFLLTRNGGTPGAVVCVDVPAFGETDVQVFFGIGREVESSSIDWNISTLEERLDARLVPIACDSGGNVFCLSLRPDDEGAVIYCDLESVFGDYGKAPPLWPVAADFDAFLGRLREL
jgi:hypothetical protein